MAKLIRGKRPKASIPTASMSDISFLLLLFFMVSTVFVKEKGLNVILPKANAIEKIPRNHSVTIYVDSRENISIDDLIIPLENVEYMMANKLALDYNSLFCFRTDKSTRYGVMSDVLKQLQQANALRVYFEARLKR
ncbi:MAG: biopolymer transporter ExbD [Candidatus Zophobacter franzmannii]|jgi:biopolymer transport protein ExbD|nr:biopolymer transporter ExbD [Candidatus Zophobacter franzmannii]